FKGKGFYITDYRSDGYKDAAKKDKESSSSSSKDGESSKSSDADSKGSKAGGKSSDAKSKKKRK
ncbi:MAG: zinc ribbon domain-containing protein, partial [Candidatus Poribacteria bacterium]|nr:zinc ribbon domain-containing protein [Candidatus Poribacteria bacterium]